MFTWEFSGIPENGKASIKTKDTIRKSVNIPIYTNNCMDMWSLRDLYPRRRIFVVLRCVALPNSGGDGF